MLVETETLSSVDPKLEPSVDPKPEPSLGAPIVTPPKVTVMLPAGMGLLPTVRTTFHEVCIVCPLVIVLPLVKASLGVKPDATDVLKLNVALIMVLATFRESALPMQNIKHESV